MTETSVLVELREGYRVITLNRPQRLNAFTEDMHRALRAAIEDAEGDRECRACSSPAPAAASAPARTSTTGWPSRARPWCSAARSKQFYNPLVRKLRGLPIPVVAAVNGVAAGAGCNIALACDVVLAARSATFVQAFARIGLVPDSGGTWFLPRLVGPARARGLALLAEPLSAEKAESWGLIWKCVPDAELMDEATKLCVHFASAPTYGLGLIKRALDASETNDLATQLDMERDFQRDAGATPDYAEGVRAFIEKRPPRFTGRKD